MQSHRDVLIMGGGAQGLAIALELALQGATVTVLSRQFQEAALHAAAGMLAPQAEGITSAPLLDLCLRSRSLYPEWTRKLEALTGIDPEYWPCGIIAPAYGDPIEPLDQLGHEWCDRSTLDALQPGLSPAVVGGKWFPEDAQVNNQVMAQALRVAVQQLGVTLHEGITVEHLEHSQTQVTGVQTTQGRYHADTYIVATGAWTGALLPIPLTPRKGQLLALRQKDTSTPLQHILFAKDVYLVPRRNGRVVVGATSEDVGFTPHNTAAGIQQLLTAAIRLYPALADAPLEQCWWGFRPTTPDELPILGIGSYPNLLLATGHYRNGILLIPVTAKLIIDLLCHQRVDPILKAFAYDRFDPSPKLANKAEGGSPNLAHFAMS